MTRFARRLIAAILVSVAAAITASCSRDSDVAKREYVASGDSYLKEGKYQEAIIEYRNAIKLDRAFGDAHYKLAEALVSANEPQRAILEYVRAADLLPNRSDVQLKAGALLLLVGRFDEAKARATHVLQQHPQDVDAQVLLGNATAGLKDFDQAIREIEEAIQLAPDRAGIYMNLGAVQQARGNPSDAEAAFRKAIQLQPRSIAPYLALANYFWSTNRVAEAEQILTQAFQIDPKDVRTNRALAAVYVNTNRADRAEQHLKVIVGASQEPGPRLALADFYTRAGRFDEAVALLSSLEGQKSAFEAVTVRLAAIQFGRNQRAEALKSLDQVLKTNATNVEALTLSARILLTEKRIDEARQRAKAAVSANPGSAAAQFVLGLTYVASGDADAALRAFDEVLKINPRATNAQLELAKIHLARGDANQSVQLAEAAMLRQPDNPVARLALVQALIARRDFRRAQNELNDLTKKFPQSADVVATVGRLDLARGAPASARRSLDLALKLDPDNTDALTGLVALELASRRPQEARVLIEGHLSKAPTNTALLILAARTYATLGDLPKVELMLQEAIEVEPANLQAYGMLGQVYLRQNKLDLARANFENLSRKQSNPVPSMTMVAMIRELQGQIPAAKKGYEAVLAIDPRAPVAANNLAWIYAEEGQNLNAALQLAQTAKQLLPDRPEVEDTLGWVYYKNNLAPLAISLFRACVEKDPSNPLYHYHLGLAYLKTGDKAKARQSLERALKLKPDFRGADDAKKALAEP